MVDLVLVPTVDRNHQHNEGVVTHLVDEAVTLGAKLDFVAARKRSMKLGSREMRVVQSSRELLLEDILDRAIKGMPFAER